MKFKNVYRILFALFLTACGPVTITSATPTTVAFLPDLAITSAYVSMVDANGSCLGYYGFFVTVINQGTIPAPDVVLVETSTGQQVHIGTLDVSQSITMPFVAKATSGMYTVVADPQNTIIESDETNNSFSYSAITPTPPAECPPPQTPAQPGNATPTPVLPETPSPVSLDGLFYADMNLAEVWKISSGGYSTSILNQSFAQFSPGGLQALFESGGDIFLAEPMDTPGRNITSTPDKTEISPQWWAANPSRVVFNTAGINEGRDKGWTHSILGYLAMIYTDGTDYVTISDEPSYTMPALSPDGKTIAFDKQGWPWLYEIGAGARRFDPAEFGFNDTPLKGLTYTTPSFSPDGTKLTWWVSQGESQPQRNFLLVSFDLLAKTTTTLHSYASLSGTLGWLPNPIWSPSGQWIAFQTRGESTAWDLWITHQAGEIGQHFGLAMNPVWSPDSQRLAFLQQQPRTSNLPSSLSIIDVPSWNIQQPHLPIGSIPLAWIAGANGQ